MINYFDAVDFDEVINADHTTASTNGRGGGGGEPNTARIIASMGDRKVRFDGEYFQIPNTRDGQKLAELITGVKQRRRGSWIVLRAHAYFSEVEALSDVFNAMKQAVKPRKPDHYEDTRRALMRAGVRGGIINDLALQRWITPEIVENWMAHLTTEKPPDNIVGVLINSLKAGLIPPNHNGSHYRRTFKRLDPVSWEGGSGWIHAIYKDGLRGEVVRDDDGELFVTELSDLSLIEIAADASLGA